MRTTLLRKCLRAPVETRYLEAPLLDSFAPFQFSSNLRLNQMVFSLSRRFISVSSRTKLSSKGADPAHIDIFRSFSSSSKPPPPPPPPPPPSSSAPTSPPPPPPTPAQNSSPTDFPDQSTISSPESSASAASEQHTPVVSSSHVDLGANASSKSVEPASDSSPSVNITTGSNTCSFLYFCMYILDLIIFSY